MSDKTFSEFLTFCEEYLKDTDAVELKKLMIRRYNDCNHDFKFSSAFEDLVFITRAKIDSDSSRVFVHLRDFLGELKAYRHKKEKKKGTKRVRDSGLSDVETPSPKSLRGENSESSSDERVSVSERKHVVKNNKSDSDSGVESKTGKSEKSPLVNGIHEKSNDVNVLEVANQSDDDCVMVIDGDEVKDSSRDKSVKTDDITTAKSPLPIKKNTNAFQAAFQNFTHRKSEELDDSQKQESRSALQNENEDREELPKMSSKNESDSAEKSKVITSKEVSKSNNDEKNSGEITKNVNKDDKEKCNKERETTSDESFDVSPKPSTSSDYKIPKKFNESKNDICNDDDIASDNVTDSKSSDVDGADKNGEINSENGVIDVKSSQNGDVGTEENQSTTGTPEKTVKTKKASQRQIRRLEQLLEDIRDQIEKLKERELSLDDLDDDESAYVLEDKYQKKFVKVWNKLCELKGRAETTGRPTERRFIYTGTRYPEINRKIERFVNRKKIFPDYGDIHNIIARVNMKQGLGLKGPRVDQLSRETFADVGNRLQKRRKEDLNITFLGHLTKNSNFQQAEDPALKDPELKKTLEENKKISKTKLEDVINKFADKQVGEDTEELTDNKENDEDNDDEEEEEAETEDIEVPEINHIIHDISDEEGENNNDAVSKSEIIITPIKERKKRVEDMDSDSSSENEDSGDDEESSTVNKEVKVVVTDIMKYSSPYKYGLDELVKESEDIVIETDENCRHESQDPIEIEEDETTEVCENRNNQNSVEETKTVDSKKKSRNLIAEFDQTEDEEQSKSVSPELKSKIDSLVTALIDEDSRSSSTKDDGDSVVVKSRSTTPELTLKITAVRTIEQMEICEESESINCQSESENSNCQSEPISFREKLNDHSELTDLVEEEKCTENFETISVDSSENDSEDIASFSEVAGMDEEIKVIQESKINAVSESDSVLSESSKTLHMSESSTEPSSSSPSSSFPSEACRTKTDTSTLNDETSHTPSFKKSSVEPSKLLNRIMFLARNKFKLNKSDNNPSENHVSKQPIENKDVIEIDDSDDDEEELCSNEIEGKICDQNSSAIGENDDDVDDDDVNSGDDDNDSDVCIILSDSD